MSIDGIKMYKNRFSILNMLCGFLKYFRFGISNKNNKT